uniref:Uncharacterized protein n=1 Tax=Strombidium inclinatum TaxID=197538 RepID=A0A7S3IZ21_9SPIT|mmetsp:Transcript_5615/g.8860  ORF Transcript_5615/g.8860 Transcript_5615/m.8860 type:complete len:189 (+) Transcript_5615:455-1021(+)
MPSPNPYGFKKADTFWTFGKDTPDREAFDHKSAREVFIPSENQDDAEATHHPLGFDTTQVRHHHHHKRHQKNRHSRDLTQVGYWGNGNGSGSEKQDGWWDIGHATKSEEEFDHKAAWSVFMPSDNKVDGTPSVGPNNWSQVQLGEKSKYSDYWRFLDYDSKDSEEFFDKARKPDIGSESRLDREPSSN